MPELHTRALRRVIGLRRFPLFADADIDEVATIAENGIERTFRPGSLIVAAGTRPRSLFMILEGRVMRRPGETLEAPAVIGALEVFAQREIEYSAIAATRVRTLEFSAADVGEVLEDNFGVMLALIRTLAARLVAEPSGRGRLLANRSRAPQQLGLVERLLVLRQQLPFSGARLQALTTLAKAAEEVSWPAGTAIVQPGDPGQSGLVLIDGEVRIVHDEHSETIAPASIGILEAIAGVPHTSLILTATPVRALRTHASAILDMIEDHTDVGIAMIEAFASALIDAHDLESSSRMLS